MLSLNKLVKLGRDRDSYGRGGDHGGTSGRGHKGQKSRSGGRNRPSFEGGQMPLSRRLPKRGFNNKDFSEEVSIVNLQSLEDSCSDGDTVTIASLIEKGLIKNDEFPVKILGGGVLTKKLVVQVNRYSAYAQEAIEKTGGRAERI